MGDDFLRSSSAIVDFGQRIASFKSGLMTVSIFKQNLPVIRVATAVTIPAMSEAVIDGKGPFLRKNGDLILEPIGNKRFGFR